MPLGFDGSAASRAELQTDLGRSSTVRIAALSRSLASPGSGVPFLVAPGHHAVRTHKQRSGFLDLADALPFAVQVLRFGRAGHDDPQERQIEPATASFHAVPARPVTTVKSPFPVTSSVDMRVPSGPTSHACGIFAPGRVVG